MSGARALLTLAVGAALLTLCWNHGFVGMLEHVTAAGGPEPTPTPRPDPAWMACHRQHVAEIKRADDSEKGFGLLFYGDSITEDWVGTNMCQPVPRAHDVAAVFKRHYGKFDAGVMAVGGDQSAHLLWRLRNGEVPAVNKPRVAVVLIGTNDLGAAAAGAASIHTTEEAVMRAVPGVTLRVLQTLHTMKDLLPQTHIILLALLPRGGPFPGPGGGYHWPSVFAQPSEMVNLHFRDYTRLDGYLHFLDCGERFLTPDFRWIRADLMPDALHPNAAGYELLAECLDPLVTKLMQHPGGIDKHNPTRPVDASTGEGSSLGASLEGGTGPLEREAAAQKA